jgi:hypothetical protein
MGLDRERNEKPAMNGIYQYNFPEMMQMKLKILNYDTMNFSHFHPNGNNVPLHVGPKVAHSFPLTSTTLT